MAKALVTWGGWEGHEPEKVGPMFADWLREAGMEVTLTDSLSCFDDAEALRVVNSVGEDHRTLFDAASLLQLARDTCPVEDVVAKRQRGRLSADERFTDKEGLRQPSRLRLHRVVERHTP